MVARHLLRLGTGGALTGRTAAFRLFVLAAFGIGPDGLALTSSAFSLLTIQDIAQPLAACAGAVDFFYAVLGLQRDCVVVHDVFPPR